MSFVELELGINASNCDVELPTQATVIRENAKILSWYVSRNEL